MTAVIACVFGAGCSNGSITPHPIAAFGHPDPEQAVVAIASDYPIMLSAISTKPRDVPLHCTIAATGPFGPVPGTGPITRPVALSGITPPVIGYVPAETWFAVIPPGTYYVDWLDQSGWPKGYRRSTFNIAAGERLFLGTYLFSQGRSDAPPENSAPILAIDDFHAAKGLRKLGFMGGPEGCPYRGLIFVF